MAEDKEERELRLGNGCAKLFSFCFTEGTNSLMKNDSLKNQNVSKMHFSSYPLYQFLSPTALTLEKLVKWEPKET